ncbi:hypothetical protein Tco_0272423 [Tanacetum coccineum]
METQKAPLKDEDGEEVDVYLYRSMIGSLMYLTSSRPYIMFVVYLPFDLVAYADSDYARASLDRKSTTRGCQFLRCRLISWQCKKQTVVANSTIKAEYVAASSCCVAVLTKSGESEGFKQIVDFLNAVSDKVNALTAILLIDITTCIEQFLSTAYTKRLMGQFSTSPSRWEEDCLLLKHLFVQVFLDNQQEGMMNHNKIYIAPSHTEKVFANIKRQGKDFSGRVTPLFSTMTEQIAQQEQGEDEAVNEENVSKHSNDPLLSGEDRLKLKELMALCTNLQNKVKLLRVVSSKDEGLGEEDASKQGRKIHDIEADENITPEEMFHDEEYLVTAANVEVSTANPTAATITTVELTLAQTLAELKSARPETKGVVMQEPKPLKMKKKDQVLFDEQEAIRLQAQFDEEERIAREKEEVNAALITQWNDIQDKVEIDYELAQRQQRNKKS